MIYTWEGCILMLGDNMETKIKKCTRLNHRTSGEKDNLIRRLNIIEGQVRGIKQMIEKDRYCDEVMMQISAINKSLKSLGNEMLKSHIATCVAEDLKSDNKEVIDDLIELFTNLNK